MESKIALIHLHGFLQDSRIISHVYGKFKSHLTFSHDFFALDLPGYGLNKDSKKLKLDTHSQISWLENELKHFQNYKKCVLIGYSMGARLALSSLSKTESLIDALIIESGSNGIESETDRSSRRSSDAILIELINQDFNTFLDFWKHHATLSYCNKPDDETLDLVKKVQREQNPIMLKKSLEDFGTGVMPFLHPNDLRQAQTPILFIAGKNDHKFSSLASQLSQLSSSFSVKIVQECGHRVHLEQSVLYFQLINEFITNLEVS